MEFKIKLPKDAHYLLYTSLYSQIHPLRLKKEKPGEWFLPGSAILLPQIENAHLLQGTFLD